MSCPNTLQYIRQAATSGGLDIVADEALNDIRSSFHSTVDYGISTNQLTSIRYNFENLRQDPMTLFLRNPLTGGGRFIEDAKRVYVLNHAEWMANTKFTKGPTFLGQYIYDLGAILLHSNGGTPVLWCRNVIVHETLHSTSLYSRIWSTFQDIIPKHLALIEGITECLNMYVLLKKHPTCYNMAKASIQGNCQVAYKESTRLFCSLAQVLGIDPFANFYFSMGQTFSGPWGQFINSIHSAGFNEFNYALSEQTVFREHSFREECIRSIKGFKRIYDSEDRSLDFSKIQ